MCVNDPKPVQVMFEMAGYYRKLDPKTIAQYGPRYNVEQLIPTGTVQSNWKAITVSLKTETS